MGFLKTRQNTGKVKNRGQNFGVWSLPIWAIQGQHRSFQKSKFGAVNYPPAPWRSPLSHITPSWCRSDSHPTVLCQGLCREHFGGSPDLQVLTSAETGRRHSLRAGWGLPWLLSSCTVWRGAEHAQWSPPPSVDTATGNSFPRS